MRGYTGRVRAFNIGIKVLICDARDLCTQRRKRVAEPRWELAYCVGLKVFVPECYNWPVYELAVFCPSSCGPGSVE